MWWKIDKLEKKIDEMKKDTDTRLEAIEKVAIIQEANLRTHMQRSEHLETIIEKMEETDLKPLRKHVAMMEGALKLVGIIGLLIGMVAGVVKIVSLI